MKLTTRTIAVTGMLSAIAIILGITPLGLIPVPTLTGRATIMHIPVIIGAIIEGPIVGMFVGLIFGLISFITTASPLLKNPIIAILPRVFIGLFTYFTYKWSKSTVLSASIGGLTNTIGVLGLGVVFELIPLEAALGIAATQSVAEIIVGVIITLVIVRSLNKIIHNKNN